MTTDSSVPIYTSENQLLDAHISSNPQSLSAALYARHSDYTISEKVRVKIGSWNVAGCPEAENDLSTWFVQNGRSHTEFMESNIRQSNIDQNSTTNVKETSTFNDAPNDMENVGLYVLGLQEVMSLNGPRQYIGMVPPAIGYISRWRKALEEALPQGYVQIVEQQLSGLLLFIYASPSISPRISSVSSVRIGTGMMGYLGNKGAIVTRIVLGETTRIVFVNAHLSSGPDSVNLERRLWDVNQITERAIFEPINRPGLPPESPGHIGDEEFGFWFGDLNFRLDKLPGDQVRRLLMLHAKGEYKIDSQRDGHAEEIEDKTFVLHNESDEEFESSPTDSGIGIKFGEREGDLSPTLLEASELSQRPTEDPASLQATLNSLLPHDQLKLAQKQGKAFHDGWHEGQISFLPTYKYDIGGEGAFDTSEKRRVPSWCDRILYRTRQDKLAYDEKCKKDLPSPVSENYEAKYTNFTEDDRDVLFDYDPDQDGAEDIETINADALYDDDENDESYEAARLDNIKLELYTSYQCVVSSDHKPVVATFTLEYDIVVPELKAKVHQEVARGLDRVENERRPGITVVIDDSMDYTCTESNREPILAVDFGDVTYKNRKIRHFTIANTSQVRATVSLMERNNFQGTTETEFPLWLSYYFIDLEADQNDRKSNSIEVSIDLEPGESINVAMEVYVEDIELIRALNDKACKIEDILVLHVNGGRDHFIPVRGTWLPSCLGRSIDQLIRIPRGGVRSLLLSENSAEINSKSQDILWSVPRELFKLTEAMNSLTSRVVAESSILETTQVPLDAPGWPFVPTSWVLKDVQKREPHVALIFDALDNDHNLIEVFSPELSSLEKLEIVSEVLLDFLSSLQDGIITKALWANLEQAYSRRGTSTEEIKAWFLDTLSIVPHHNISFVFLITTLAQMVAELAPLRKLTKVKEKSGLDNVFRKGWSWKIDGSPTETPDLDLRQRNIVEKAIAEVFVAVLFRGVEGLKDRERKSTKEKQRVILQEFLKSIGTQNG
ncbi:hypothetical protein K3495_g6872 [Podosphaera aphanis]|nr:hypothetical protein K3495_g6872 [Podosphaera aphanis]